MTTAVILFLVGIVHGAITVASVAALRGRRVVDTNGRRGRRRSGVKLVLGLIGVALSIVLLTVELGWFYAVKRWDEVERVNVDEAGESVLEGDSGGTNYLLVGTDNRPGVEGNRSDTMLVLRTGDGPARIMSIPRDLLVPIPTRDDGGELHRINAAYNDGPVALIRTVQESVGIPIDRYIEINFVSFGALVDALGGVTINFPHPAFDEKSGLNVEQSGR